MNGTPGKFLRGWLWICAATVLLILAVPRPAQAQASAGAISGQATDTSGGAIPGARVTAHAPATGLTRHARANANGHFHLADLPAGEYQLRVTAPGFAPVSARVIVVLAATRSVSVRLSPAIVRQEITVAGAASSITTAPLDTTSAVRGGVVTAHDLNTVPMAMRSFANMAYLVPGTEPVEPSDPTKARITAVSFGGSSGLNDKLTVDGADDSDDYIGGFLQNFSPAAIQEFRVSTAQQNADVGRTVGGSVAILTKRGTNELHGQATLLERAAALNARFPIDNPAPSPKQPFSDQDYSGAAGGPVARNRLWWFASLEYNHENASIAYSPASQTQFAALSSLAQQGLIPGVSSIAVPSMVPVPFRDVLMDFRLDWNQSPQSQWFWRASTDTYHTNNGLLEQGALPSTGATTRSAYENSVLSNTYEFSPTWLGHLTLAASLLRLTQSRNSNLGFALAFPFSSTYQVNSGFETFGDNQFVTPITAFPVERYQEKYQFRYDVSHEFGAHALRFGVGFIHEPVLSGALASTAERLTIFPQDPVNYLSDPAQFTADLNCAPSATPGATCTATPASDGYFAQNVQRLGLYVQDAWQASRDLTINYGLRYDTTFGLFAASGRSQLDNPAYLTLQALGVHLVNGAPHDYRLQIQPRLGIAYAPGGQTTVFHAGIGLFDNDLAQNGWVRAFQAVNQAPTPCAQPGQAGCLPGAAFGGAGSLLDPQYQTPYALHVTAGVEHAFSTRWMLGVNWTHEEGNHGFRAYTYTPGYTLFSPLFPHTVAAQQANVPDINVYRTDNRSRYDALLVHLQGDLTGRLQLTANYTLSSGETWGCILGELFDYVNGVCNPNDAFAPGDYGPSGENVTSRFVFAAIYQGPGGLEFSTLTQAESARPFTMTTPVDVNGLGDPVNDRAVINGVQTSMDQFRGTPYFQVDLRVARPVAFEHWRLTPFVEFFNLLNRNNPGAFYVTSLAALPTPVNSLYNATAFCLNSACTQTKPITSLKQLEVPAGAFGDFFGPGTTVGIPFAAQLGLHATF